jgi:hypothetical protein
LLVTSANVLLVFFIEVLNQFFWECSGEVLFYVAIDARPYAVLVKESPECRYVYARDEVGRLFNLIFGQTWTA